MTLNLCTGEKTAKQTAGVKQGGNNVLFCLDGVGWSHIVAGDITTLACRQGASEPPVPFSVRERERETERDSQQTEN